MKLPESVHNLISYIGAATAVLSAVVFTFLLMLDTLTGAGRAPYAGILIFIVVPAVLLSGLFLIPIGMTVERRRRRRTGRESIPRFPIIDLNEARYRNATLVFVTGSVLLLFLSVFSSYQAYEVTESVAFCGTTCHTVMEPEYVTYQHSPHARVRCVDCHVGPGAGWFVKSKLSGSYQVYAVLFDKYPRPIPGTIESLRPAQETCEQCHWPRYFFGSQEKKFVHFLPDEKNTRWEIDLLIKTGGAKAPHGKGEGIHWHMNIASRVEYIATDEQRQTIPWVRLTDLESGEITVYESTEEPLPPEKVAPERMRLMDCMDCHNRPTHVYLSPSAAVNEALQAGRIDPTLPYVKKTAVDLLAAEYATRREAFSAIAKGLRNYYRKSYPAVAEQREDGITAAVLELQEIHRRNFFPTMKARWDVYPDNVGHLTFLGCDRCHDGAHVSSDGKKIRNRCDICHTITAQGPPGETRHATTEKGLRFEHPDEETGDLWEEMTCSDCHTGA
jgi:hypothetical protein